MTAIQDTMPSLRQKKTYVVAVVSFIGFLGGLAVTCEVRLYVVIVFPRYIQTRFLHTRHFHTLRHLFSCLPDKDI